MHLLSTLGPRFCTFLLTRSCKATHLFVVAVSCLKTTSALGMNTWQVASRRQASSGFKISENVMANILGLLAIKLSVDGITDRAYYHLKISYDDWIIRQASIVEEQNKAFFE